jgi:uncharacterized protein (DUF697 family)
MVILNFVLTVLTTAGCITVIAIVCGFAFMWGAIKACTHFERLPFALNLTIRFTDGARVITETQQNQQEGTDV